jgi:hypothetical protein
MVALSVKVDPHRRTIEVPEGNFEVYRESDRYMVGRVPDGQLLGYFQVELTDHGRVVVRTHVTGQLGLGTLAEAGELLEVIGNAAVENGIASA